MLAAVRILWGILIGILIIHPALAQYNKVSELDGIELFSNNEVTVTYDGNPDNLPVYGCGVGPYCIGGVVSFLGYTSPISYTFTFNQAVNHVKIDLTCFPGPIITEVNGVPYLLNSDQLSELNPNACYLPSGTISGSGYLGTTNNSTFGNTLIIKEPNTSSVTIAYIGPIYSNGASACRFSFYFGQINVSNNGPVCIGDSLQLWGDTTITEPGTFAWSGPNGYTSSEQHPIIYPLTDQDTGVYTLTYITGVDTFTDTTHITLLPGPDMPVINADSPVCSGSVLLLSTPATAGAIYSWLGPNGFTGTGSSVSIPDVQQANAGTYTVTASLHGCSPAAAKEITITEPVTHRFTEVACGNTGYDFNGQQLYEPGTYVATFTGSNGCDSMSSLNLVILPGAEAEINYKATGRLCLGDSVLLHAEGNGIHYRWYDHDGVLLGEEDQLLFPLTYSENEVRLVSTATNDCSDTDVIIIPAEGCCEVLLPNAFSPNGDGLNDRFSPISDGHYQLFQLSIFNRWGERVFHGMNSRAGWDGMVNNRPADVGTYFYYVIGRCALGTEIKEKGEVTLIR